MALSSKRLGKHIDNLQSCGNMWKRNNLIIYSISNIMIVNFNVFGALMVDWISSDLNSTSAICM